MATVFASFALALAVLMGGGGLTVAAAQDSVPGDALYPVKTWSEDVRKQLTSEPDEQLALSLDLIDRRLQEMQALVAAGEDLPPEALQWLESALQELLELIRNQPDPQAVQALERVREHLAQESQRLLEHRADGSPQALESIGHARARIEAHMARLQEELQSRVREQDHERIQDQAPGEGDHSREQEREREGNVSPAVTPAATAGAPGQGQGAGQDSRSDDHGRGSGNRHEQGGNHQ
jgi:hypothetical protein